MTKNLFLKKNSLGYFLFLFDVKNIELQKMLLLLKNYTIFKTSSSLNKNFLSVYIFKPYVSTFLYLLKKLQIRFNFFFFNGKSLSWNFYYNNFLNLNFFKKFSLFDKVLNSLLKKKLIYIFSLFFLSFKYLFMTLFSVLFLKKFKVLC